jgi:hypothetical protein
MKKLYLKECNDLSERSKTVLKDNIEWSLTMRVENVKSTTGVVQQDRVVKLFLRLKLLLLSGWHDR